MKRFHYAIKAINDEMFRHIGKVASKYVEKGIIDPLIAVREQKVKNLKMAIKILEEHKDNKHA